MFSLKSSLALPLQFIWQIQGDIFLLMFTANIQVCSLLPGSAEKH